MLFEVTVLGGIHLYSDRELGQLPMGGSWADASCQGTREIQAAGAGPGAGPGVSQGLKTEINSSLFLAHLVCVLRFVLGECKGSSSQGLAHINRSVELRPSVGMGFPGTLCRAKKSHPPWPCPSECSTLADSGKKDGGRPEL